LIDNYNAIRNGEKLSVGKDKIDRWANGKGCALEKGGGSARYFAQSHPENLGWGRRRPQSHYALAR